ncbi:hypothetical protein XJ32_03455 [Helicobacter bilis]|uniref:SH3 domain-containing protein n=1 Tax=Helicobacter bilis TaxID=37372 RepID=A0A1Q2LFV7_9HELI|nr:hypothetical protein [Helicobacter bilis]AQQ59304.1 hypothetical protein XJ32_03455 [Helicobacter bilis]
MLSRFYAILDSIFTKTTFFNYLKGIMLCFVLLCINPLFAIDEIPNDIANSVLNNDENDEAITSTDNTEQAKILNITTLTDIDNLREQTLYVGQYISITYRLVLLDEARIVYTEFNPSLETQDKSAKSQSVQLIKESEWQKEGDYYTATYTFKIIKPKVVIPSLVVHVQNNYLQDSMQTDSIDLQAQALNKTQGYSGVVANSLKIIDYTLESYDDNNNMILIELEGNGSNLEDFRLPNIKDQEFGQGTKFSDEIARVNVLARIPKELNSIEFSYFDINKHEFIPLSIKNAINIESFDDEIKEDLNPKSSFLKITNILLIILGIFLLITLIKRSYFAAIISCLLLGFIVYRIFSNTYSIKTLPNARVLIQPTHNSTELFVITNPTKLEAIDKKNDYYKVNIDSKVGWISRNDTNKR